jgi:hypothetical protein
MHMHMQKHEETVVHEIVGQQGCMRSNSLVQTMTRDNNRLGTCTPMDVFDFVVLRIYVDNDDDSEEPSVEVVVNHLFGIHHTNAITVSGSKSKRRTVNNYLYSIITANGSGDDIQNSSALPPWPQNNNDQSESLFGIYD